MRLNPLWLGTTGPRTGGTHEQLVCFVDLLLALLPSEFHHGDCIGWDAETHDLVREHLPECRIVVHPPADPKLRAYKDGDLILPPLTYHDRNRAIVASVHIMCAPKLGGGSGTNWTKAHTRARDKGMVEL